MAEAAQRGDSLAFFVAARHAVQLQLGAQWGIRPEAITLDEVRRRDPQLGETWAPPFRQADEIIYSGRTAAPVEFATWQREVHDLLQFQPA